MDVPTPSAGATVQIFAGVNLTMNVGFDIVIAESGQDGTSYSVIEDYTFTNGMLTSAKAPHPGPTTGPPRGISVVATPSSTVPLSLVTFGENGAAQCILGPC
jgi:hypothetical protein